MHFLRVKLKNRYFLHTERQIRSLPKANDENERMIRDDEFTTDDVLHDHHDFGRHYHS